jgi:hypothetical protein
MNKDLEILKMILLAEAEEDEQPEDEQPEKDAQQVEEVPEEEPKPGTFEADPMSFILKKYVSLNSIMSELMTPSLSVSINLVSTSVSLFSNSLFLASSSFFTSSFSSLVIGFPNL